MKSLLRQTNPATVIRLDPLLPISTDLTELQQKVSPKKSDVWILFCETRFWIEHEGFCQPATNLRNLLQSIRPRALPVRHLHVNDVCICVSVFVYLCICVSVFVQFSQCSWSGIGYPRLVPPRRRDKQDSRNPYNTLHHTIPYKNTIQHRTNTVHHTIQKHNTTPTPYHAMPSPLPTSTPHLMPFTIFFSIGLLVSLQKIL